MLILLLNGLDCNLRDSANLIILALEPLRSHTVFTADNVIVFDQSVVPNSKIITSGVSFVSALHVRDVRIEGGSSFIRVILL